MSDYAPARDTDPQTSHMAAKTIKTRGIMWMILQYLSHLDEPRNGWEMSVALDLPTITVVPRLAPLRRQHAIRYEGPYRPGPSNRSQGAYVVTQKGLGILNHEVKLVIRPPREPWENLKTLQGFLLRALDDGWTEELKGEVAAAFATFPRGGNDD
jgi:hypothetical protein